MNRNGIQPTTTDTADDDEPTEPNSLSSSGPLEDGGHRPPRTSYLASYIAGSEADPSVQSLNKKTAMATGTAEQCSRWYSSPSLGGLIPSACALT